MRPTTFKYDYVGSLCQLNGMQPTAAVAVSSSTCAHAHFTRRALHRKRCRGQRLSPEVLPAGGLPPCGFARLLRETTMLSHAQPNVSPRSYAFASGPSKSAGMAKHNLSFHPVHCSVLRLYLI